MSFANDDEFEAFLGRDRSLPTVTPEAVAHALQGFNLQLLPAIDTNWLATAVRRSLAITIRNVGDGPQRTSNADVRIELERLAKVAESTWQELFECEHAADSRLWDYAWRNWDGEGGTEIGPDRVLGEPCDYRRFKAATSELNWLTGFLRSAADATDSQRGPWRQSEQKRLRIERGLCLALIFETAFGEAVTANNFPDDARHKAPTPFMDFYSRMITLAFGAVETTNLAEVVKTACQMHRRQPAQFAEGVIPGL